MEEKICGEELGKETNNENEDIDEVEKLEREIERLSKENDMINVVLDDSQKMKEIDDERILELQSEISNSEPGKINEEYEKLHSINKKKEETLNMLKKRLEETNKELDEKCNEVKKIEELLRDVSSMSELQEESIQLYKSKNKKYEEEIEQLKKELEESRERRKEESKNRILQEEYEQFRKENEDMKEELKDLLSVWSRSNIVTVDGFFSKLNNGFDLFSIRLKKAKNRIDDTSIIFSSKSKKKRNEHLDVEKSFSANTEGISNIQSEDTDLALLEAPEDEKVSCKIERKNSRSKIEGNVENGNEEISKPSEGERKETREKSSEESETKEIEDDITKEVNNEKEEKVAVGKEVKEKEEKVAVGKEVKEKEEVKASSTTTTTTEIKKEEVTEKTKITITQPTKELKRKEEPQVEAVKEVTTRKRMDSRERYIQRVKDALPDYEPTKIVLGATLATPIGAHGYKRFPFPEELEEEEERKKKKRTRRGRYKRQSWAGWKRRFPLKHSASTSSFFLNKNKKKNTPTPTLTPTTIESYASNRNRRVGVAGYKKIKIKVSEVTEDEVKKMKEEEEEEEEKEKEKEEKEGEKNNKKKNGEDEDQDGASIITPKIDIPGEEEVKMVVKKSLRTPKKKDREKGMIYESDVKELSSYIKVPSSMILDLVKQSLLFFGVRLNQMKKWKDTKLLLRQHRRSFGNFKPTKSSKIMRSTRRIIRGKSRFVIQKKSKIGAVLYDWVKKMVKAIDDLKKKK